MVFHTFRGRRNAREALKGLKRENGNSGMVSLKPVPIEKIMEVEAKTLGIEAREAKRRVKEYRGYIDLFVDNVLREHGRSLWLTEKGEAATLAGIVGTLYGSMNAEFKDHSKIIEAIRDGGFNCYSSTIVVSDVMVRLGIPVGIAAVPGHVLPHTNRHLVETTAEWEDAVRPVSMLNIEYTLVYRTGVEGLLGIAWNNYGMVLAGKGMAGEAVKAYDEALSIIPEHAGFMFNKGSLLAGEGLQSEALAVYRNLLRGDAAGPNIWQRISIGAFLLGDIEGALNACEMAVEENPHDKVARQIRDLLLTVVENDGR